VSSGKPTLVLTSEPSGAEIEINGEFIGNTPTTIATKDGSVTLRMKKAGFQTWERTLNLNPGDRRTINSQLMRPEDMTVIRTKLP